jgi:predicted dienelactone hydrolase
MVMGFMGKEKKILLLLGFVLFFASCGLGKSSKSITVNPQKTGITTICYFDQMRDRPLITEVWYPVEESTVAQPVAGVWLRCPEARDAPVKSSSRKYPLIMMSHGNGSDRMNCSWIAEILAANGFIVAAMDHHGNTWNNKIAECFVKIWERPIDVSFVIDQVLKDPRFGPHINAEKIGFVGYSLGGQTGVWMAGGKLDRFDKPVLNEIPADQIPNIVTQEVIDSIDFSPSKESYRDTRVSAFFLMAPALGDLFDVPSLESIEVPVYIVAPESDHIVPFETNAKFFATKMTKSIFTLIPGAANHYIFLNEVTKGGKMLLDKKLAFDPPSVDRKKVHHEVGLEAVQFFKSYLK